MVPEKHKNMAENLKNMRKARGLSLTEFSKELDIPKSTLQSVLADGQTSLNTAFRISEKLRISLDVLTNGILSAEQICVMDGLLSGVKWFSQLPQAKQKETSELIYALIRIIEENPISGNKETTGSKRTDTSKKKTNHFPGVENSE